MQQLPCVSVVSLGEHDDPWAPRVSHVPLRQISPLPQSSLLQHPQHVNPQSLSHSRGVSGGQESGRLDLLPGGGAASTPRPTNPARPTATLPVSARNAPQRDAPRAITLVIASNHCPSTRIAPGTPGAHALPISPFRPTDASSHVRAPLRRGKNTHDSAGYAAYISLLSCCLPLGRNGSH